MKNLINEELRMKNEESAFQIKTERRDAETQSFYFFD